MATSCRYLFLFGFVVAKKAIAVIVVTFFFFGFIIMKMVMAAWCHCLFLFGSVAAKKAMVVVVVTFFFVFEKKKTTIMSHRFFLWFCCSEKGDGTKLPLPSIVVVLQRRKIRQHLLSPSSMALL